MQFTGLFQIGLVFIVILLTIIALIWSITLGIRELVVRIKLGRSGVKVDGHITDHRKEGYKPRKYYLTYDYDYNGSTYSRKEEVSFYRYYKLNNEYKVSVSCLPEDPKTARLDYKIPDSLVDKGIAVAFILIGIAVVIIALAIAFIIVYFVFLIVIGV